MDHIVTSSGNKPTGQEDPGARKKGKASGGMVIDLHVHTSPASPCSSAPVDRLVEEAKKIGLDGICLTDHNFLWDPGLVAGLREKHGFLVMRGNEITTDQGDMVVFGLYKDIQGIIQLKELREEVRRAGGFMIVAHPFRGFLTFGVGQLGLTPEKAMERPLLKMVDAVEVLNGKVTEQENRFASEVAAGLGLPVTGGSDAHEVDEVGVYATRFAHA
ncbi:MAG: PHP domain-containing protein, partial [Deltaproteobacteria bacterium]|nr:PHP domain-containing protein [Deltaproteobacteria bacterium]